MLKLYLVVWSGVVGWGFCMFVSSNGSFNMFLIMKGRGIRGNLGFPARFPCRTIEFQ